MRVVSEAFGADVGWLHEERTVQIDCDITNAYKYDSVLIGNIEDFSQEMATPFITDDYRSVKAYPTPYFSPQAKFYKYSAVDTWNEVELRVFYGGFLEVEPVVPEDETPVVTEPDSTEEITEDVSEEETNDITEEITEETPSTDDEV